LLAVTQLSDAAVASLIRGVGSYLRTADQKELPANLRRLRSFRPGALGKHKDDLLGALDLEATRALILQWLDDGKPPLSKADAAVLRSAVEAGNGWRESFAVDMQSEPATAATDAAVARLEDLIEREKERTARAREGERAAKEALKAATAEAAATNSAQAREIAQLRRELGDLQEEVKAHRSTAAKASEERAGERRRAERALERERREREEAESALKTARRDLRKREAEVANLTRRTETPPSQEKAEAPDEKDQPSSSSRTRTPLKAPLGLLDDDPKSLASWLRTEDVQLLVDGYNVSKSGAGFANLSLADQRKRVVQAVNRLARKNDLAPIVVFDGAETPPGTSRRGRGPAVVEYSTGEIADDHLIARLETLPPKPVVFVTDDKELQRRAAALGATIASSAQLLALVR
jgi:predicted RNA-binding protein with PIN domain